jgi:hypothetical protein
MKPYSLELRQRIVDIMSVYMPIIKLTQRRKGAKNLRTFYYGYATGHDMIPISKMKYDNARLQKDLKLP